MITNNPFGLSEAPSSITSSIWKYIKQNPNVSHMAICELHQKSIPMADNILNTLRSRGQIKFQTGTGYIAIGNEYMLPAQFEKWLKSQNPSVPEKVSTTETTTEEKKMENEENKDTPQLKINQLKRTDKELITNIYNFVFSNPDISRSDCINKLALMYERPLHERIDDGISYLFMTDSIIYSDISNKSLRVNPKLGTTVPTLESQAYIARCGHNANVEPSSVTMETLMFDPNKFPKQVPQGFCKQVPPGFYNSGPGPVVVNKVASPPATSVTITLDSDQDIKNLEIIKNRLANELGFMPTSNQVISHLLYKQLNVFVTPMNPTNPNFTPSQQHSSIWPDKNGNVPYSYGLTPSQIANPNMANNNVTHATSATPFPNKKEPYSGVTKPFDNI